MHFVKKYKIQTVFLLLLKSAQGLLSSTNLAMHSYNNVWPISSFSFHAFFFPVQTWHLTLPTMQLTANRSDRDSHILQVAANAASGQQPSVKSEEFPRNIIKID